MLRLQRFSFRFADIEEHGREDVDLLEELVQKLLDNHGLQKWGG